MNNGIKHALLKVLYDAKAFKRDNQGLSKEEIAARLGVGVEKADDLINSLKVSGEVDRTTYAQDDKTFALTDEGRSAYTDGKYVDSID